MFASHLYPFPSFSLSRFLWTLSIMFTFYFSLSSWWPGVGSQGAWFPRLEVLKTTDDCVHHHGLGVFSGWRSTKPQMILYIIMALANAMCSWSGWLSSLTSSRQLQLQFVESRPTCDFGAFRRQHETANDSSDRWAAVAWKCKAWFSLLVIELMGLFIPTSFSLVSY